MDQRELFRSCDLLVRHVGGFSAACCVVTFDSFTDHRTLDRPGFGEGFLRSREIDAIHVISRENDWYHYEEMAEAMACVQAVTRLYGRVMTYGSSMGAYAAIRFAGLVGADRILALSPQFSIDPAVAPFEQRWVEAGRRFRPVWERRLAFPEVREAYVAYDPTHKDAKHIALLEAEFRFIPVRLPRTGHPVTAYLSDVGMLEMLFRAVLQGGLDVTAFTREAWRRRARSTKYYTVRAIRSGLRTRKIMLLWKAARLAPSNPEPLWRLGAELGYMGLFKHAVALHEAALALAPEHPNILLHYSFTVEESGDFAGALALMERAEAGSGGGDLYLPRIEMLRVRIAAQAARSKRRRRRGVMERLVRQTWRRLFPRKDGPALR